MYSRQPTSLVISRHYCYKKFILLNDDSLKNFRESYVFHCLVIKVLCLSVSQTACLLYHIHQCLSSTFFKFFRSFFDVCVSLSGDLFTLSHLRFFVNNYFLFFQNFSNCLVRRNNSLRQLSQNTTVIEICQHFLKLFLFFNFVHSASCSLPIQQLSHSVPKLQ